MQDSIQEGLLLRQEVIPFRAQLQILVRLCGALRPCEEYPVVNGDGWLTELRGCECLHNLDCRAWPVKEKERKAIGGNHRG